MPTTHHQTSVDPWMQPRRTASRTVEHGFAAAEAGRDARILHHVAGVLLAVVSVLAACALVAGIAMAVKADTTSGRTVGLVIAGSAVVAWLTVALQCLLGQAVARYIEYRTER